MSQDTENRFEGVFQPGILYREDLSGFCKSEDEYIIIHPLCHPKKGVEVFFYPDHGVVGFFCSVCLSPVTAVRVAGKG